MIFARRTVWLHGPAEGRCSSQKPPSGGKPGTLIARQIMASAW
eukprot:CAMPEP_0179280420 /NCGR_PEP_ID=MMETSP0797-20121207/36620_1 /TAXON_ID=47934 /ORGANISM="Dinophysis acuminata, Strain DAEP01" /LENGTH=42 /DNA_ID= /DNA_START= /DNA_END= /DNA_ORIENTATION=